MRASAAACGTPFDRVDATDWVILSVEKRGSTPSTWLQDPDDDDTRWLHKDTVIPKSGNEQGEDWSELVSTQVAQALGVPAAPVRMCTRNGRRGSLSKNIRPDDSDLFEGLVVLEQCPEVSGYFPHREGEPAIDPSRPHVKRPGHSVGNIALALADVAAPPGFRGPAELSGFDVFTGYLVLDALIANRDRHEENWAVLRPRLTGRVERLAPTYDHASSLGYNLLDRRRDAYLEERSALEKWTANGTAYRFEHEDAPETLVELMCTALNTCSADARAHWASRVSDLDLEELLASLRAGRIPEMSVAAGRFAAAVLRHNHRRVLDAIARA